ncbi:MAG: hypothetical protein K0S98_2168 [Propionibacteriaceae bacterium]|nr:hypothetical protein [Propionibacteriaceae bacterium]
MPAVRQVAYLRGTPFGSAIGMVFDSLPDCDHATTVADHPRSLVEDGVLIWPSSAWIIA